MFFVVTFTSVEFEDKHVGGSRNKCINELLLQGQGGMKKTEYIRYILSKPI